MSVETELKIAQSEARASVLHVQLAPDQVGNHNGIGQLMWNVRAVELICKPGKIAQLRACIRGPVTDLLRRAEGFSNAMILHAHRESRRVLALSFWETEQQATSNRWEDSSAARKLLSPLIDICAKVETYEAILPEGKESEADANESRVC
jgi:hypothetical protein